MCLPEQNCGFLWLVFQDKVLTNSIRHTRHLTYSTACDACGVQEETLMHILQDCPMIRGLWSSFPGSHAMPLLEAYCEIMKGIASSHSSSPRP
ncbi:hypothetical protein V6N11_054571 [Hibiscus sabdariffa]|uniref:Reverse transcriptase zinc-binding domain-containing protein n=1 Tax=Hibiscus sabdariffa TaxID=183260 RepID=A0ABR2S561_9ROSI